MLSRAMKALPDLDEVLQRMRNLVQGIEDEVTKKRALISSLERRSRRSWTERRRSKRYWTRQVRSTNLFWLKEIPMLPASRHSHL